MSRGRIAFVVAWFGAALCFGFALLVIAPGRGAGWMVDDGLFLANAWNAAHGFGLDGMLPQEPVYLVNAMLMKFGLSQILHQRYAFYVLLGLGAWVFFGGLEGARNRSWAVPVAISGTLCIAFSSVLLMAGFFPAAAGCYFHASEASGSRRTWLMIASGALFALAAFMHAALAIAMILVLLLIWALDQTVRRDALVPAFVLVSVLLWGVYLHALGVSRFFATPAGHETHFLHLLSNVAKIVWFFASALTAFLIGSWVFKSHRANRYARAQYSLSLLVTLACGAKFFGAQLLSAFPEFFIQVGFGRYPAQRLVDAIRLVVDVPGAIYYLMLFAVCRLAAEAYARAAVDMAPESSLRRQRLRLQVMLVAHTHDHPLHLHLRLLVAIAGLCLIAAGYAAGSASSFAICLSAFCGPVLGVLLITWRQLEPDGLKPLSGGLIAAWCAIFVMFATTMNLPTFTPILPAGGRVTLQDAPLAGIKESVRYQTAVKQLKAAYETGGCRSKRLILLDYVPTVYLILNHEVPNAYGVVRPSVYFPEAKVKEELAHPAGWCVLDVTTDETRTMMGAGATDTLDRRAAVRAQVQARSRMATALPSPSGDVEPMVLYVN